MATHLARLPSGFREAIDLAGSGSPRAAPAAPQSRALELGRGVTSLFITDAGSPALITASRRTATAVLAARCAPLTLSPQGAIRTCGHS